MRSTWSSWITPTSAISSGWRRIDSPVGSCLAIARRRKFMSSRSMFRARSAMRDVLEPVHVQGDVGVAEGQVEVDAGRPRWSGRRPASRPG